MYFDENVLMGSYGVFPDLCVIECLGEFISHPVSDKGSNDSVCPRINWIVVENDKQWTSSTYYGHQERNA